ncbi:MAG: hypothetical protein ACE15F_09560 [bacterium]
MFKRSGWVVLLLACMTLSTYGAKIEVNSVTGKEDGTSPFKTLAGAVEFLRADPMAADNEILIKDNGPHFLEETLKVDVQVKIHAAPGIQPVIVGFFSEAPDKILDPFLYVQISDGGGNFLINIVPQPYSTVELDGLTIIPEADNTYHQQYRQTAIVFHGVDYYGNQSVAGAKLIVRNCTVTSNDGQNHPSPVTGSAPPLAADTQFGGAALELGASGFSALDENLNPIPDADLEAYNVLVENCLFTQCWVYGINIAAEKVVIKDTNILYNGMRGIQNIHGEGEAWQSILITGSPDKPAVIKGNGYVFAADGTNPNSVQAFNTGTAIRMFGNQVIDFAWLDIVENHDNVPIDLSSDNDTKGANIRSMDHVLIANNKGGSLFTTRDGGPTFATGLAHIPLTISNCTFIGTGDSTPSTGGKSGSIFFYAGVAPVTITNSILGGPNYTGVVLGAEDQSGGDSGIPENIAPAGVKIENSALVGEGPLALGAKTALGAGRTADEITQSNVIAADPQFTSTASSGAGSFVVQNPAYQTAGPNGAFLTGARPVTPTAVHEWSVY